MKLKFIKTSFQIVERSNELVDLIHPYIGDLEMMKTRGAENIYI